MKHIRILEMSQVKLVNKPWGWERWIADGSPTFRYALKEIFIRAPNKSSIQVHKDKQETNYIQRGKGILHYSPLLFDVQAYVEGRIDQGEVDLLMLQYAPHVTSAGLWIPPGAVRQYLRHEAQMPDMDQVADLAVFRHLSSGLKT